MAGSAHRIGIASVEVDAAAVDGLRFQGEVADWVHGRLLPEIEATLDGFPATEGRVVLDRLDLVLEAGTRGDWRDRAVSGVRAALAEALKRKLSESGGETSATLSEAEAVAVALAHYLEQGALPWNWRLADARELRERLEEWLGDIPAGTSPTGVRSRLAPSLGSAAARRRFLALPDGIPPRILHAVFGIEPSRLDRWERDLALLDTLLVGRNGNLRLPVARLADLLDALLEEIAARPSATESDQERVVSRALVRAAGPMPEAIVLAGDEGFESVAFRSALGPQGFPTAHATSPDAVPEVEASDRRGPPPSIEPPSGTPIAPRGQERPGPDAPRREPDRIAEEGFHLSNAGLILLGPYLPMLFERTGLRLASADPGTSAGDDTSAAMVLLHYLATGRDDPAEFELVLPKVLCGLHPRDSFEGPVALDPESRVEADQLLASVVHHWEALKGSSVEGLREGFLVREGKLSLRDGIWRLRVEQKPWDMLLERLPWSIRFTKHPWMASPLTTEWME